MLGKYFLCKCALSYFQDNIYHCSHLLQEEIIESSLEKESDSYYAKDGVGVAETLDGNLRNSFEQLGTGKNV